MRSSLRTVVNVLAVALGVLVIGGLIGWFTSRPKLSKEDEATVVSITPERPATATNRQAFFVKRTPPKEGENPDGVSGAGIADAPASGVITNWEEKLDEILVADIEETRKAKLMLEMFPRLPPDGQTEFVNHMVNLTPDEDFGGLGKILTNAEMPEPVLDTLLSDSLNRPNSMKMPLLLEVARNPEHPKATEAKDLLELFLEDDYGSDWSKWEKAAEAFLKENPD